jgi:TonB family protein
MRKLKMIYMLAIILIANVTGLAGVSLYAKTPVKLIFEKTSMKSPLAYETDMKLDKKARLNNNSIKPAPIDGTDLGTAIDKNIEYPKEAIKEGIEGQVKVLCTIEKDGRISNVLVLEDIGGNCGQAVCNAIKKVSFTPAQQNGYPHRYNMIVPVSFTLKK